MMFLDTLIYSNNKIRMKIVNENVIECMNPLCYRIIKYNIYRINIIKKKIVNKI